MSTLAQKFSQIGRSQSMEPVKDHPLVIGARELRREKKYSDEDLAIDAEDLANRRCEVSDELKVR